MRISDWSSDVCSSDLEVGLADARRPAQQHRPVAELRIRQHDGGCVKQHGRRAGQVGRAVHCLRLFRRQADDEAGATDTAAVVVTVLGVEAAAMRFDDLLRDAETQRSEEHTSELQSLMRNSYAVFCLKKKK